MAEHSHIEWTDATWNPITGCSVISPGCTNCYAMKLAGGRLQHHPSRVGLTTASKAGPVWNGQVRFNMDWIEQPLNWTRPRMIFVCAHGDLFHEDVPVDWIAWVYGVAIAAVHLRGHILQVLTKRSARMRALLNDPAFWDQANAYASDYVMGRVDALDRRSDDARATLDHYGPDNPPPGIWVGVSAEDEPRWIERAPDLVMTPAAVRWISAGPLLGPIWARGRLGGIDQVVVEGESGPGARPMHPDWVRLLEHDCAAEAVPFFFKQWGAWKPLGPNDGHWPTNAGTCIRLSFAGERTDDGWPMQMIGKKAAGRLLDGRTHDGMPRVT